MAAFTASSPRAADPGPRGPSLTRTAGPTAADRSPAMVRPSPPIRSWPLLVLAAPAAAEVWSGWVGIAQKTGFGLVSPLPGIWPSLHLDTAITLPIGVEAYAAYALRAWLDRSVSDRTRRFAKWSAICSFALGMAGQIAYHLLAQAGMARAPWPVTTIVSCLPVLVLGMGTALAHMLRADAEATQAPDSGTGPPATLRSLSWSFEDQDRPDRGRPEAGRDRSPRRDQNAPTPGSQHGRRTGDPARKLSGHRLDQARVVARRLAATGQPVTRRALRSGGVRGSTEALNLNALARTINAELADTRRSAAESAGERRDRASERFGDHGQGGGDGRKPIHGADGDHADDLPGGVRAHDGGAPG